MKPIKYQAWDGHNMHEVYQLQFQAEGLTARIIVNGRFEKLDKPVLREFTGLLDQDGNEIYEGDIVVTDEYIWFDHGKPNYRGTVEWIYSQWQVVAHCVNPEKAGISDGINEGMNDAGVEDGEKSEWSILGNIYANPELLATILPAPLTNPKGE